MTTDEIQVAFERFMERVAAILTPDELAVYRAYQQRLETAIARHDTIRSRSCRLNKGYAWLMIST